MKPLLSRFLVALGALLIVGAVNVSIVGKERIRRDGERVYLPLAPVDPRSLMQGDYMALRFALVTQIEAGTHAAREGQTGAAPVLLDERHVARLAPADGGATLALRYRIRGGHVWLGTNAFFFEEGSEQRFRGARYGEFRVDRDTGEAVLVGLRNEQLEAL